MRWTRRFCCVLWSVLALWLTPLAPVHAQALDVSQTLRGLPLGARLELLRDERAQWTIEQVSSAAFDQRFTPAHGPPSLGLTEAAYWLRVAVQNPSAHPTRWMLELGYPLLDEVTLYVPSMPGGGSSGRAFQERRTGDMLPFSQRDIADRNFVFSLAEPPASARVYYLRVRTSGTLNIPLTAWSLREFLEHQHLDWAALCIFYGVLLVMACYSACVYVFARQREYLTHAAYIVCVGITQFSLAGHTFQFLLPETPWLAQRILPASVAATLAFGTLVVRDYLPRTHRLSKLAAPLLGGCVLFFGVSFVLPYGLLIRITDGTILVLMPAAFLYAFELSRIEGRRARLFMLGWGSAISGALVYALQSAGLLRQSFLTDWSGQIGFTLQLVLLSSALADKLVSARSELRDVNASLSQKLRDLELELENGKLATQRAERATRLKDEFLATMSHEFRTPLNPIINIPQQMRTEFVPRAGASCTLCHAQFELDESELLPRDAACPECAGNGCLKAENTLAYLGDPTRTRRYLIKIQRSGEQLLNVVNGILDFSKLQAGHIELAPEPFEVSALVQALVTQFSESARRRDVGITCWVKPRAFVLRADPMRVRQVLTILLDNALKYSAKGSYVNVRGELQGTHYRFSVEDQGIGIASEHFESIFESFEQVYKGHTRKYGGTGLGLSIARTLARMHGGDLTVDSKLGMGSTFCFSLPNVLAPSVPEPRLAAGSR